LRTLNSLHKIFRIIPIAIIILLTLLFFHAESFERSSPQTHQRMRFPAPHTTSLPSAFLYYILTLRLHIFPYNNDRHHHHIPPLFHPSKIFTSHLNPFDLQPLVFSHFSFFSSFLLFHTTFNPFPKISYYLFHAACFVTFRCWHCCEYSSQYSILLMFSIF
jgi:hypothetical protein